MKKVIFIFTLFTFVFACKKSINYEETEGFVENKFAAYPKTDISFDKTHHDFGTIQQGEVVETQFILKNIGKNDLYIDQAKASCGCTVPEVTKDPIKPGKSTPIKVKFDSNGKQGIVEKAILITCNSKNTVEQLFIKVNIELK